MALLNKDDFRESKDFIEYIIRRSNLFIRYVRGMIPSDQEIEKELNELVKEIDDKDKIIT